MITIVSKLCSKCGEEKACGDFGKNKNAKSGLQGWCKPCKRKYDKERRKSNPWSIYDGRPYKTCIKRKAQRELNKAVKRGDLIRPDICSACKSNPGGLPIEAHHTDYSKVLDVVWLCRDCHQDLHFKERNQKNK